MLVVAWAREGCLPKRPHWPFVVSGPYTAVCPWLNIKAALSVDLYAGTQAMLFCSRIASGPSWGRWRILWLGEDGKGLRNKHIAERLYISEATVRQHLTAISAKLDVSDRFELAIYAYQYGLAKPLT